MHNFETVHDRRKTRSVKWDNLTALYGGEDVLPMWVADMDFQSPRAVIDALKNRAEHGIYGYTITDASISKTVSNWVEKRHGWRIKPSWLLYSPGVVTSLHMAIQTFTEPGEQVVIQTPVYAPFYSVVTAHDRKIVENPLLEENGTYQMDFEHLETCFREGAKTMILCNPHNPVGRVWMKEELKRLVNLCQTYDVLLLSDEIHADLIHEGYQHIPIASLSEDMSKRTITFLSPSKTFNLAGLQVSYSIVEQEDMRKQLQETFSKQGFHMLNTMAVAAMEAAYTDGEEWLDGLLDILAVNRKLTEEALADTPLIQLAPLEGTYLMWLDCRQMKLEQKELMDFFAQKAKLGFNDGVQFGEAGTGFVRMNIACPPETMRDALDRLKNSLKEFEAAK
ncbi:MalY/PatB family protein [Terribacillus saccharophilus]|uniref:cysteine-S-conjugate beta-lyase n=1 Tax=Terribacillus saccharophilus TaxID=361277 RepID=A0ABX4GZT4_9BACI|nr:PatB family C-S lyase [Terribacillus saccharophilus]PAD36140.1 cystathionine beta-lyase [Terribacillus saccharophilus]PAD96810.1 cystathionine beta-lyase [Terribacillus saccharophilus]PAE00386.1 cystathionine beta-lyase [Terribacillus saccharophilus]